MIVNPYDEFAKGFLGSLLSPQSVKIEELTTAQIIAWFERDAELKRSQGESAGSLQW